MYVYVKLEILHHLNHSEISKHIFNEVKVNTHTNLKNSKNKHTEKGNTSPTAEKSEEASTKIKTNDKTEFLE